MIQQMHEALTYCSAFYIHKIHTHFAEETKTLIDNQLFADIIDANF